mgnify:CR=1 FL=1
MTDYETIAVVTDGAVATLSLNRPDVRNAMNPVMIREITAAFDGFNTASSCCAAKAAFSAPVEI